MTAVQGTMKGRLVVNGVIPERDCALLVYIARSLAVLGYRAGVCSATISDLATACPPLLLPLVAAREAVRAAVEEALDLPLLVEFTGLISWRPGSRIGWHHDANRPYLQQRAYSAVCYLNIAGVDFQGGTFRFQDGQPREVHAAPGRVVAYSAQDVHRVDPITAGERFTLTLWFTEDLAHCEDTRLLSHLAEAPQRSLGLPASMWRLPDGTDLRLCRLALAGFAVVWQGRMLHSTDDLPEEGSDGPAQMLQLAVQPDVLHAWLDWQCTGTMSELDASDGSGSGGGAMAAAAAAAETVINVEFEGMQQAVLAVQHFLQHRGGCSSTRERVCRVHLYEAPTSQPPAPSCAWLRSYQLESSAGSSAAHLLVTPGELQEALGASRSSLAQQQAELEVLLPRWQQTGALFCDGEFCTMQAACL